MKAGPVRERNGDRVEPAPAGCWAHMGILFSRETASAVLGGEAQQPSELSRGSQIRKQFALFSENSGLAWKGGRQGLFVVCDAVCKNTSFSLDELLLI